jgi:hypothetical protein
MIAQVLLASILPAKKVVKDKKAKNNRLMGLFLSQKVFLLFGKNFELMSKIFSDNLFKKSITRKIKLRKRLQP